MFDYTRYLIQIAGSNPKAQANAMSVALSLEQFGGVLGLDQPHRFVQFLAQIAHESARFKHDVEIWGPTPAQARYDTRTNLGNTPEADGDGELYKGRTGIQITGKSNYRQFRDWCKAKGFNPPDFVKLPHLVNSDPWEGLAPLWYWDTRNLNAYADKGDNENITVKINGGRNGLADRLDLYTQIGLGVLGHTQLTIFQTTAKANGTYTGEVDGQDGPQTRAAIHRELVKLGTVPGVETQAAPVVEPVAVAPQGADRVAMTRSFGLTGIFSMLTGFFVDMPLGYKLLLMLLCIVAIVVIVLKAELIARRVKEAIKAFDFLRIE